MPSDFYDLLGVDENASEEEIKESYRNIIIEIHPDHNDEKNSEDSKDFPAKIHTLQKARDVLTDENKRKKYDRIGHHKYINLFGIDIDGYTFEKSNDETGENKKQHTKKVSEKEIEKFVESVIESYKSDIRYNGEIVERNYNSHASEDDERVSKSEKNIGKYNEPPSKQKGFKLLSYTIQILLKPSKVRKSSLLKKIKKPIISITQFWIYIMESIHSIFVLKSAAQLYALTIGTVVITVISLQISTYLVAALIVSIYILSIILLSKPILKPNKN